MYSCLTLNLSWGPRIGPGSRFEQFKIYNTQRILVVYIISMIVILKKNILNISPLNANAEL